jgi:catechol 2,3-dioxygenase-like lactoylglutathione lyase family enzyme
VCEIDCPGFRHVGIVVRDIERSLAFYQALGLEVLVDYEESAPLIGDLLGVDVHSLRIVKLGRPPAATCVELLVFDPIVESSAPPLNGTGITHFALTVESVDAFYEANQRRWSFLSEPRVSFDGRVKLVFCRDPEGNVIEVVSTRPQTQTS